MNASQLLSNVVAFSRSPIGQALWETAKYGAPRIAAAVKQQTELTPTDVAESTQDFASAADVPLDAPAVEAKQEPVAEPTEPTGETP